jgi:hypothetical protein
MFPGREHGVPRPFPGVSASARGRNPQAVLAIRFLRVVCSHLHPLPTQQQLRTTGIFSSSIAPWRRRLPSPMGSWRMTPRWPTPRRYPTHIPSQGCIFRFKASVFLFIRVLVFDPWELRDLEPLLDQLWVVWYDGIFVLGLLVG